MDIMDIMALLQLQHQLEIVAPHGASGCQFQHSNTQQTATAAAQLLEELIALLGQLALHFAAGFPQHPGNMLQIAKTANSQSDIQLQPLTSVPLGVNGFQFQPSSTLLLARAAMVMQLWLSSKHCQSQNKSQKQLDRSRLKASHFEGAPLSSRKWAQSSV